MSVLSRGRRFWRLGDRSYPLYSGQGAKMFGARWNSPGTEVLYAAASLEGALLELLVHTNKLPAPKKHGYIWIDAPSGTSYERVTHRTVHGWRNDEAATQAFGDLWVSEARSCLLFVPSVVVPRPYYNVVINPNHAEATGLTHLAEPLQLTWDSRLFK